MKNKKEAGRRAWKAWKQGNLRGYTHIGQRIMKEYGLTQADIDDIKRETWNNYKRLLRVRKNMQLDSDIDPLEAQDEEF